MDNVYIYLIGAIGTIIGVAITYCYLKKKIVQSHKGEGASALQDELNRKNSKIESLDNEVASLNSRISELQVQLKESDNLLALMQSGDENECLVRLQKQRNELSNELKVVLEKMEVIKNEAAEYKNKCSEQQTKLLEVSTAQVQYESKLQKVQDDLKNAEEELEEAEDEIADLKRKCNDQKQRLNEKSVALDQCENKFKKAQQDLARAEDELQNQKENLSRKQEVLKFINEVLQAKEADNKDIKDVYTKVNNIQSFVENELCDVLKEIKALSNEEAMEYKQKIWQWANLQRKTWLQKNKVVAFVGEFSAGKTTIVNRILSQDDDKAPKLPVSSKATTAIATYISYAFDFNSQFTDPYGKLKMISKATFEMVNKDILSEANVSSLIQYFVMSYKNKNLENLSMLDTPGFNSNDKEDARRTSEVIREADVLFWVFDANVGEINQTSLNTIKNNLQGLPLFIIINKSDSKSPSELNELEAHIKDTICKNRIAVSGYIRFSKKEPLTKLMNAIKSVPHNDDKNAFISIPFKKVEKLLVELNTKYSSAEREYRILENKNMEYVEALIECFENIEYSCEDVQNMPERIDKWFTSDYYKITKERFVEFSGKLDEIIENKNQINILNDEFGENSKQLQSKKIELNSLKENRRKLEELKKRFDLLLRNWNPSYLKSI